MGWFKKLLIVIILLILIPLLILGCMYQFAPETGAGLVCSQLSGKDQDHCYKWIAGQKGDPALCERIKGLGDVGVAPKAQCFEDIAREEKDVTICEMIKPEYTNFISTDAYRCAQLVARDAGNDPAVCQQLSQEEVKQSCLDFVAKQKGG